MNEVELALSQLRLSDYLEATASYVSVVELGLYASSVQLYEELQKRGIEPDSDEWKQAESEKLEEQRQAMAASALARHSLLTSIFASIRWTRNEATPTTGIGEPIGDRGRMMRDHGLIGRRYAGKVKQIISGSIGFDDWEWGVDLFANDPLVFKKLIYEMRF